MRYAFYAGVACFTLAGVFAEFKRQEISSSFAYCGFACIVLWFGEMIIWMNSIAH